MKVELGRRQVFDGPPENTMAFARSPFERPTSTAC